MFLYFVLLKKSITFIIYRLHDYSFTRVQALVGHLDRRRRRKFCRWVLRRQNRDPNFVQKILFTDECCFGRESTWNFRNEHYWSDRNLFLGMPRNFQIRFSVKLWAGILNDRLIGTFQLDGNLTGPRYNLFLRRHLPRLLRDQGVNINQVWWMQDGCPAHHTQENLLQLRRIFGRRVISIGARIEWPPRSPDLNPLDFFFWGHLKSQVYRNPLENLPQLEQRIEDAILTVTPEMLARCIVNFTVRLRVCLEMRGRPVEPRMQ